MLFVGKWRRPILPVSDPTSTFGAGELNFCVRNGNRWDLSAIITTMVYITLFQAEYIEMKISCCLSSRGRLTTA